MYRVDELQPGKHPIPGLVHASLHGRKQHGMRGMEMWMQTFAPSVASPMCVCIHDASVPAAPGVLITGTANL